MPIVDIQKRFRELGRIRTGLKEPTGKTYQSGPKKGQPVERPKKLARFRLTSPWEHLIRQAADEFGGDPAPWDNDGAAEWEVIIEDESLPVVIPPGEVLDQWYELWTGGGCSKRCDGVRQVLQDRPCSCPADPLERQERAAKGEACKPTTRLRLMIPDVADVGIWRLESHGFHAAAELGGAVGLIEAASRAGALIPADLRLAAREGARRTGQPRKKFFVPSISFRGTLGPVLDKLGILTEGATMPAILGQVQPRSLPAQRPALPPVGTTFDPAPVDEATFGPAPAAPALPGGEGPEPTAAAPTPSGFAPPDGGSGAPTPDHLPETGGPLDVPDDEPLDDDAGGHPEGRAYTGPQIIAMRFAEFGVTDRAMKLDLVSAMIGRRVESTKDLTPIEVREVLRALDEEGPPDSVEDAPSPATSPPPAPTGDGTPRRRRRPAPAAPTPPEPTRELPDPHKHAALNTPTPKPAEPADGWDGARWREVLAEAGVKVGEILREASKLARAREITAPASLDEIAGSGLADELAATVDTLAGRSGS